MRKAIHLLIIMIVCVFSFYVKGKAQKTDLLKLTLKEMWSTDKIFETPESVIYDAQNNIIYVSNISGSPGEKDGHGFISKLSPDGKIEKLQWIEGLNAPKGMGLYNNKLYVSDLDQVVEISIKQNTILKKYKSSESLFLNDIAIDNAGNVYVSDNRANLIFHIKNGKLETWLKSSELNSPNGLFAEKDRLLIGNDGYVLSVDFKTKKIKRFIDNTTYIDGLVSYGNGYYLISNFSGAVHLIHPEQPQIKILDTSSEKVKAADIGYIYDKGILLVPTFSDNRIVAYQLKNSE